uniref:Interferon-related developmental regulator N-terminal domain-containing protein n=1 Tax=Nicotiana tabacum TaxID=4097 RepID=A0A1S4BGJ2_TOBAC|nr:PREDICTED: uncharacterized protein LOC107808017 [Nicotiana tabacum]
MKNQRLSRPQNRQVSPIGGDASAAMQEKQGSIQIPKKKLYSYLQELYKKKSSRRENALRTLVEEFETNVRYEFAKNNFFTLVHRCQNCLKRSSALEVDLALQLIGLVVLTLGAGDNAHEIYEESLVFLPKLLNSKLSHSVEVLECLSIVTLVAARDFVDTERTMEIIWQFMNQETKHSSYVTAAAISAWALLLSDINICRIGHKKWKELIPYLLKQLEEGDEDVTAASIDALALIFEKETRYSNALELYKSEYEEGAVRIFLPEVRRKCCRKRIYMSPNSLLNKGKTKLMNKYRSIAKETKAGHYHAEEELD